MAKEPLRIGNAEREQAVSALGEHFAAGRLDADEYAERVGNAYQARYSADLDRLFADLPSLAPAAPPVKAPARRGMTGLGVLQLVVLVLAIGSFVAWARFHGGPPIFIFPLIWFFLIRGAFRRKHYRY